jgi:hypothetical protein
MAVSRSNKKRPEDEQVEGASKEFDFVAALIHGRYSTLDGRLSTIEIGPRNLFFAALFASLRLCARSHRH